MFNYCLLSNVQCAVNCQTQYTGYIRRTPITINSSRSRIFSKGYKLIGVFLKLIIAVVKIHIMSDM